MAGTRATLSAGKVEVHKFRLADDSEGTISVGAAEANIIVGGTDTNYGEIFGVVIEYGGGVWGDAMSKSEKDAFIQGITAILGCTGGRLEFPSPSTNPIL